jgi:hypothetical protein
MEITRLHECPDIGREHQPVFAPVFAESLLFLPRLVLA